MKKSCLVLFLLVVLAAVPFAWAQAPATGPAENVSSDIPDFDPARDAATDIRTAIAQATASHRRILLDVGGRWCSWCQGFDRFWLKHPDLRAYRDQNYVVVKINFSPENPNPAVLSKYPKAPGYPHLYVLDSDGTFLHSQDTSPLEAGPQTNDYNPERVAEFLHQWAPVPK